MRGEGPCFSLFSGLFPRTCWAGLGRTNHLEFFFPLGVVLDRIGWVSFVDLSLCFDGRIRLNSFFGGKTTLPTQPFIVLIFSNLFPITFWVEGEEGGGGGAHPGLSSARRRRRVWKERGVLVLVSLGKGNLNTLYIYLYIYIPYPYPHTYPETGTETDSIDRSTISSFFFPSSSLLSPGKPPPLDPRNTTRPFLSFSFLFSGIPFSRAFFLSFLLSYHFFFKKNKSENFSR